MFLLPLLQFRPSPEEAIDTMHALFTAKGTKVPTLKTTVDYSFTGKALHNWKIMESAKTPEDLVGAVSVVSSSFSSHLGKATAHEGLAARGNTSYRLGFCAGSGSGSRTYHEIPGEPNAV